MQMRRRSNRLNRSKSDLSQRTQNLRNEASLLPYGPVRDAALKKARQAEAAAHMDDWLNSPGLRPPKDNSPGPE